MRIALLLSLVLLVGISVPVQAGDRPGPGDSPITLYVRTAPRAVAPGETVIVKMILSNRSREDRELIADGTVRLGRDVLDTFSLGPVRLGAGERRSFDHPMVVRDDALLGRYAVFVEINDAVTDESITRGGSGFAVQAQSPIRMALPLHPHQTQPGGGILLHVGLQNVTDAPLVIALGGRVTRDGRGVGELPSRRVELATNERMAVRIPFAVPDDAPTGVYVAEVVAGQDPRDPFAARHARFVVVPPAPAMIDAAVRPNVASQGDTVALAARVSSNADRDLELQQWGLIRGNRGAPVRMFRARTFTLPAGRSITNSMRWMIPGDLPPGRYSFEVWIGPAGRPGRPLDHSSAEFTVRPRR